MFEHLQEISEHFSVEQMTTIAEEFLDRHPQAKAQDIYRWLWEGEFGAGSRSQASNLDELTSAIRKARMHKTAGTQPMWEYLGLTQRLLHINIIPYSDAGCPLKRLLNLGERIRDFRPDQLRFKMQWGFLKTQVVPGMRITVDELNSFENEIPFHMTPELPFTEEFTQEYGTGYIIVPQDLFFETFPEYNPHSGES